MTFEELMALPVGTPVWTVSLHRCGRTQQIMYAPESWRLTHQRWMDTHLLWLMPHDSGAYRIGGIYGTPRTIATSLDQAERVSLMLNLRDGVPA